MSSQPKAAGKIPTVPETILKKRKLREEHKAKSILEAVKFRKVFCLRLFLYFIIPINSNIC